MSIAHRLPTDVGPNVETAQRDAAVLLMEQWLPSKRLTRGQLARVLGQSTRPFLRRLSAEGTTYERTLRQVREQIACRLLAHSDLSIAAVAEATGYRDRTSFSRAFRGWAGVSPSTYRTLVKGGFHVENLT